MSDTMGARIEQARLAKGLNVTQLSRRIAVKPTTLKNWESDRSEPRANKMAMVAGVLGVSVQWLLEGGEELPSYEEQLPGSVRIAKKLELALALQQRLSQILFELESDVARMQHDWAEEVSVN
ncbi:helix-turn-helix domain-containing protein [Aestuariispira insulae]|uniref:Helix-turn-helix protein n=1 Tax=Aestuariispira insulae TaxID=1461337 RepID=A0A3D9HQ66_9PROT|nr:helix-turn-helix transcriptional regulator [Aestuariispira insulae]RED51610.1 helix-turn-helix protein [Aestuariispira insulae]